MFFLKALPTQSMVDHYVGTTGLGRANTVMQALSMMRSASLLIRLVESHFSLHGLSQLKFLILVVIDREPHKEGLRHGEVRARIDVSKPVLSRSIRALVSADLLLEAQDDADARSLRLRVTESGREKLAEVLPGYFAIIQAHMHNESIPLKDAQP